MNWSWCIQYNVRVAFLGLLSLRRQTKYGLANADHCC